MRKILLDLVSMGYRKIEKNWYKPVGFCVFMFVPDKDEMSIIGIGLNSKLITYDAKSCFSVKEIKEFESVDRTLDPMEGQGAFQFIENDEILKQL